jgi:Subtilase family
MSAGECESVYGRRPVVAVLDTGVPAHTLLDVKAEEGGGYAIGPDGFVAVDGDIQMAIRLEGEQAVASGDRSRQVIRHPWDSPVTAGRLAGEVDTETGHGMFIADIVRQVASDARVLAVRIMHSDGIAYEGDLICALSLLADRVAAAEEGDLAAMVDVVSLSLGYFSESAAAVAYGSGLLQVIDVLLGLGVVVVASAGTYSTSRRFYPAAFAERPTPADRVPLISVGALKPNHAPVYSNSGEWITAWAYGAATASPFPADVSEFFFEGRHDKMRAPRDGPDPDDFSGGLGGWSGPSFAAPQVAAQIVRQLLAGAVADPALRLDRPGEVAAVNRVTQALVSLGWPG